MGIVQHQKTSVLLLIAVYLFVVLAHISLLPNHHQTSERSQSRYNSIFKRKLENTCAQMLVLIHRTDKSVLNKDQYGPNLIIILGTSFLILLMALGNDRSLSYPVPIRRYFSTYTSFRLSLRI